MTFPGRSLWAKGVWRGVLATVTCLGGMARGVEDRVIIPLLQERPKVDGELDEKCWQSAAIVAPLGGRGAGAGQGLAAMARVFYTRDALCLGFVCAGQDQPGNGCVAAQVRPLGARAFTFHAPGHKGNDDAPGVQSAVRAQKAGWTAEIVIPLGVMAQGDFAPRPGDVWGLTLSRCAGSSGRGSTVLSWPAPPQASAVVIPPVGLLFFSRANLLPNGGAEEGEPLPQGWQITRDGVAAKVPDEADIEKQWLVEGRRSLWASIKGKTVVTLPDSLPLRLGARYRLTGTVWLPTRGGIDTRGTLIVPEAGGAIDLKATPAFERHTLVFVAKTTTVRPCLELSGDGGSCYVDDFSLEMVPPFTTPDGRKGAPAQ